MLVITKMYASYKNYYFTITTTCRKFIDKRWTELRMLNRKTFFALAEIGEYDISFKFFLIQTD